MKKLFILAFVTLFFTSCELASIDEQPQTSTDTEIQFGGKDEWEDADRDDL